MASTGRATVRFPSARCCFVRDGHLNAASLPPSRFGRAAGPPVAKIRPAIEKHGLWNGLVAYQFDHDGGKGYYRDQTKMWDYGVPAPMTLGDTECFIRHDGSVVVHTEVMY